MVDLFYEGSSDEFLALIKPLLDLEPVAVIENPVPWEQIYSTNFNVDKLAMQERNTFNRIFNTVVHRPVLESLMTSVEALIKLYDEVPSARLTLFVIEWYGNKATRKVADGDTAFAWRDATAFFLIMAGWTGPPTEEARAAAEDWARQARTSVAKSSGFQGTENGRHRVFLSYAHGDEEADQVWGDNTARLRDIKKKWDPDNLFGYGPRLLD
jgi:FAD/FMN-containing dehydrogenase